MSRYMLGSETRVLHRHRRAISFGMIQGDIVAVTRWL